MTGENHINKFVNSLQPNILLQMFINDRTMNETLKQVVDE